MTAIRAAITIDPSAGPAIRMNVWVESDVGEQVTASLANCTVVLYAQDGTVLASPATVAAPDAQGVFAVTFPDPGFDVGQTATYMILVVEVSSTPVQGVIGVTFIRTT